MSPISVHAGILAGFINTHPVQVFLATELCSVSTVLSQMSTLYGSYTLFISSSEIISKHYEEGL